MAKGLISTLILIPLFTACPWDGVDDQPITDFSSSWFAKANKRQRQLQLDTPFNQSTQFYTHNAYNAEAYQETFSPRYLFPNQIYSLKDQLRLGIRILELDVHWYLGTKFKKDLLLCHGQANGIGCVVWDRPVKEGFSEIRDWLNEPENQGEIVTLFLEEYLDGNEGKMLGLLKDFFGSEIYKPTNGEGASGKGPSATSREILDSGKRVIVVSHTSAAEHGGEWGEWVYDHFIAGPPWGNAVNDFRNNMYPTCDTTANHDAIWSKFVRISSDATNYLGFYDGEKEVGVVRPSDVPELLKCGINAPGFDMVEPDHMRAGVWSWSENQPENASASERCAVLGTNDRWNPSDCASEAPAACRGPGERDWKVTTEAGPASRGAINCYKDFGADYRFAVPLNAYENNKLAEARNAANVTGEVFLNISDVSGSGNWAAGGASSGMIGPDIAGLRLAFLASDLELSLSTAIHEWEDAFAGVSVAALQGQARPTFQPGAVNGKAAVRFQGSNSGLGSGADNSLADLGDEWASATVFLAGTNAAGAPVILAGSAATSAANIAVAADGSVTLADYDGAIAEILVYGVPLDGNDQAKVTCYLASKYQISTAGCD